MNRLKKGREWLLLYSVLFAAVAFVGYMPLIKGGMTLIWNIDGVGQYYPAFLYIGQYLRNFIVGILGGKAVMPAFDLSIGMGEDVVSALNYYGFGDPLNLLAAFATKENGAYLFALTFFLRIYLAGAAFCLYCREMKLGGVPAVMGALCYAFCGFAIYGGGRYIEWLSVLVYFPLLLLSYEQILKNRRCGGVCSRL